MVLKTIYNTAQTLHGIQITDKNSYLLVAIIDTVIVLPNFDLEGARGATRPNHAVSCRQNPIGADQRPPTDMSSFVHPKRGHPGPCTWLCVYPSDDS